MYSSMFSILLLFYFFKFIFNHLISGIILEGKPVEGYHRVLIQIKLTMMILVWFLILFLYFKFQLTF